MDSSAFEALLPRIEGDTIDFKERGYDFSGEKEESERKRAQFVKDIISMYNTPRSEPGCIVLGVEKHLDGSYTLKGLAQHVDDAVLQDKLSNCIYPFPAFTYEPIICNGLHFAVIVVPPNQTIGPSLPTRELGGQILRQHQVYIRRGSKNEIANLEEQQRVYDWFSGRINPIYSPTLGDQTWNDFAEEANRFSPDYQYALAIQRLSNDPDAAIANLSRIDWSFVIDFDPATDVDGVLSKCRAELSGRRSLHLVAQNDKPTVNLTHGTYWYCAKGLSGRSSTLVASSKWVDWNRAYGNDLRIQMTSFAAAATQPLTLVAIWDESMSHNYLDTVLATATATFGDTLRIIVVTPIDSPQLRSLADRYEAKCFTMPSHQFCHGLASISERQTSSDSKEITLPSSSGAPIVIDNTRLAWIAEDIELVHPAIGAHSPPERAPGRDFLRGNDITWFELGLNCDVERDVTDRLQRSIRSAMVTRRTSRINLFHEPGAGGTTVARRIAWAFRKDFPCAILRRTDPMETSERLSCLASLTGLPILVIIDAGAITDREADTLYEQLAARNIPAVVFQVLRRIKEAPQHSRNTFWLGASLSDIEAERFVYFLTREEPSKERSLRLALADESPSARTPFLLALVAFERDFLRLNDYVRQRLESLTQVQATCVAYLAIAHYFGQRGIASHSFAALFGLPPSKAVELAKVLPAFVRELLVQPTAGVWRTAHPLVAEESMAQLLAGQNRDTDLWRQSLSRWALRFVEFCRGHGPVASEEGLDLARRVFVLRDNSELLGYERAGTNHFSQIIDAIPSPEGRLEVLKKLTEEFPDEAHFWAHLARFYSFELEEFDNALDAINYGIRLQPIDHVLHHMKGMVLRGRLYQMFSDKASLESIVDVAQQVATAFSEARRLNPEDEHGYVSEVQMILRVVDYAGSKGNGDRLSIITAASTPKWLREALPTAEDLLAQVRQNRQGELPSHYEERCVASLASVYGQHGEALQRWDNLLSRGDVFEPPIRRQIVWTYLARCERRWDKLPRKDVLRSVALLEENLNEEPNSERNLRLWLQGIRELPEQRSLDSVIEQVAYWRANSDSLEPVFYLYVLYGLKAIEGSVLARDNAERVLEECRTRARFRRNRTKSFEWIGDKDGLAKLIHKDRLGEWDRDRDFWSDPSLLARVHGVVSRISGPESGQIETDGGLKAFYVPGKSGHHKGNSENRRVTFFLGFSYEGPRAWSVEDVEL